MATDIEARTRATVHGNWSVSVNYGLTLAFVAYVLWLFFGGR